MIISRPVGPGEVGAAGPGRACPDRLLQGPGQDRRDAGRGGREALCRARRLARIEADGSMTLLGRGNTCVNTGGEKVFPEEVERRAEVPPRRLRRAGHRRAPTSCSGSASRRWCSRAQGRVPGSGRDRGPRPWPDRRVQGRRAASGWSTPSAAARPASPTTDGRAATPPATRRQSGRGARTIRPVRAIWLPEENCADDAVHAARHRAPHCRLHPVRARRRRHQPRRRAGRARLRPFQRPG